ncbi:aldolase [Alkalihalobacterium chitinilyticum]|uniref:Aldolase n=1 Tax=Alkalihalobacterium chitinilyticum TaxID=2980103 RepID=A0ABT5VED3_9BACI|nr:aldolase [Alkalihalobacterium chitinilyticum]MDE5413811.1 aldolase [Alkalihalobacterium chitinilyticum]
MNHFLTYRGFGFNIASVIPLRELLVIDNGENIDITIEMADLSQMWEDLSDPDYDPYFVIYENFLLFHMPNTAIFLIEEGKRIYVSPMNDVDEDTLRLYLLGTCMGGILMQRRILPLHGSAIAIDGKAYAVVGDSGAGKSTLASAFLKRGYQLISDDVIPVTLSKGQTPYVTPAYPQQKLWQESLTEFGMESGKYRPIVDRETKFAIPVVHQFVDEILPLAGIFELTKTSNDEIQLLPIQKLQRFQLLFYNTYRNFYIERAGLMKWHFDFSAKMVNHIEFYQIQRPTSRFTANTLTEMILDTIQKEANVI